MPKNHHISNVIGNMNDYVYIGFLLAKGIYRKKGFGNILLSTVAIQREWVLRFLIKLGFLGCFDALRACRRFLPF